MREDFLSTQRILLIAAHPDDETIGAGALLSRAREARIVHVTDGAPHSLTDARAAGFETREAYAATRRAEAIRALSNARIPPSAIRSLGFVDQRVSFQLDELCFELRELIRNERPDLLLTHAYEGGHPDHDATAFACAIASAGALPVFEFTGYHSENGEMKVYEFLPGSEGPVRSYPLTASEKELKTRMFAEFSSQARVLKPFLPPREERFRRAPRYDFSRAPHPGRLYYENFDWGIDGETWRARARETLRSFRPWEGAA